jgi:hypothetical protein
MNTPVLSTVKQLIQDTFRQSWASGISAMMLAVTAICVALCLSVSVAGDVVLHSPEEPALFLPTPSAHALAPSVVGVLGTSGPLQTLTMTTASQKVWFALQNNPDLAKREGIDTIAGKMSLAFGAISFPLGRERGDSVRFLELLLSGAIAGSLGLLLALVWTAGFLPMFLEPSAASVVLAKPVGRWHLLVGKYLGVLTFVGFQVLLFVALTWFALGLRTDVWDMTYWWCIPLLLLQFAALYSFSALLAVTTRSTVACVFGSFLFWLLAWGVNYGSVMVRINGESQHLSPLTVGLSQAAYWVSPKPIDGGLILFNVLDANQHFDKPVVFKLLEAGGSFSTHLSLLSSLLIAGVLLAFSGYEFNAKDY